MKAIIAVFYSFVALGCGPQICQCPIPIAVISQPQASHSVDPCFYLLSNDCHPGLVRTEGSGE